LLLLAAVIATAGVVTDSTATVIGAMIVAPLMTPILGMVLSTVTVDPRNLAVSFLLVATGACAVIALGWLLGQLTPVPVVAATNSQVAGRVDPTLGDLIAAPRRAPSDPSRSCATTCPTPCRASRSRSPWYLRSPLSG
jgi:uncharacterized membrane protein